MKRRKISLLDQIMIGLLSVVAAGFLSYLVYAGTMGHPIAKNRTEIINVAKDKAGLAKVSTYNLVTTDKSYYSLTGSDAKGEKIAVIIPKKSGKITVLKLAGGVAESSLPQKGAVTIDIALFKGDPVWEVNTKNDFKIYDFKTGQQL
ncbi:cell wall elongation regulator TseB-like domain-containing protein [Lactovum odontotermitis]